MSDQAGGQGGDHWFVFRRLPNGRLKGLPVRWQGWLALGAALALPHAQWLVPGLSGPTRLIAGLVLLLGGLGWFFNLALRRALIIEGEK